MTLEELLKAKREEILRVCAKYGARNVNRPRTAAKPGTAQVEADGWLA